MLAQNILTKKIAGIILAAFVLLFLLAPGVSAKDLTSQHDLCTGANLSIQEKGAGCGKEKNDNGDFVDVSDHPNLKAENRLTKVLKDFLTVVSVIVGIAAVVMVIYGGFRFVTSAGNPESTKAGRNAILYALLGLIIVAFAQVIIKFVLNKIG